MTLATPAQKQESSLSWWVVVGPLLVMSIFALLSFTHAQVSPFFAPIAIGGFLLTWRFRIRGAAAGVFSLLLLMTFSPFDWWWAGLCAAAALSQLITALSLAEGEVALQRDKQAIKTAAAEVQATFESIQSKLVEEMRHKEGQIEELGLELKQAHAEVASFKRLVVAAQEEVDRMAGENTLLLDERLEHERRLGQLRILNEELTEAQAENRARLHELNSLRPALYELQLRS